MHLTCQRGAADGRTRSSGFQKRITSQLFAKYLIDRVLSSGDMVAQPWGRTLPAAREEWAGSRLPTPMLGCLCGPCEHRSEARGSTQGPSCLEITPRNWRKCLDFGMGASIIDLSGLGPPVSVQFSSVTQLYPTLCDPMDCSTPGFPVHQQLLELTQIHVHRVTDEH